MNNKFFKIDLGYKVLKYQIIYSSRRTKTISAKFIEHDFFILSAPLNLSEKFLNNWLVDNHSWLMRLYKKSQSRRLTPKVRYFDGSKHWFLGCQYGLKTMPPHSSKLSGLDENNQAIYVKTRGNEQQNQAALYQWYRAQAHTLFTKRMLTLTAIAPWVKSVPKLTIRRMVSRWGSCSSEGKITLNLHLIKTPLACIDYVILHELCHLKEFNHSKKFYALMYKVCPDWQARKQKLEEFIIDY